jgi:polar amino acid transport system permease protein
VPKAEPPTQATSSDDAMRSTRRTDTPQPAATRSPSPPTPHRIPAIPSRHPGRWLAAAVIVLLVAMLGHSLLTNPRYQWDVVGDYLLAPPILAGVVRTLELTAIAMLAGIVLGVALAAMGLSHNPIMAGASRLYVWLFRGTPLLVQLLFWNFLAALYPRLSLGVPFGPELVTVNTNSLVTTTTAAVLGLGLNEGAYMAEIVRGGIASVDPGQTEAALALGMHRRQALRRIVLPQALACIIPPTGNEVVAMLKTTSIVSVIAATELLSAAQLIYARTFQTIPLLIVASLWYLAITSAFTLGQSWLERRTGRSVAPDLSPTALQRLLAFRRQRPS